VKKCRIAISGLHGGDNPQPGAGIIRSLRRRLPGAHIIGLAYDVMESGIYAEDGPDEVHLMPYPAAGALAMLERLDAVRASSPFDLFIPTLDAEIELFAGISGELRARGLRFCLPDARTLRMRAKPSLPALAAICGVRVPETHFACDVAGAIRASHAMTFPLMVKGPFYDAKLVHSTGQLAATAGHLLSEWGSPVILQRPVTGSEFNVLGLGDGRGGWLGHCCIRKTQLSDKGKGVSAITVADRVLSSLCAGLIRELKWPGPFEIELIREETTGEYVLIEINPRFPAWVDFPSMLGANFPARLVEMLRHDGVLAALPDCPVGSFYIRHQIEVVGDINRYADLLKAEAEALGSPLDEGPRRPKKNKFNA